MRAALRLLFFAVYTITVSGKLVSHGSFSGGFTRCSPGGAKIRFLYAEETEPLGLAVPETFRAISLLLRLLLLLLLLFCLFCFFLILGDVQ